MNWFQIVFGLTWPPAWTLMMYPLNRSLWGRAAAIQRIWWSWQAGCFGVFLGALVVTNWAEFTIGAVYAVAGALLWWWNRRRGKRAPRAYGAKSRALLAALVRKAKQAARGRPVLRPVPGGAR